MALRSRRTRLLRVFWPVTHYLITNLFGTLSYVYFHLLNSTIVMGRENIPHRPGTLLLSNHQSMIDSFLVGLCAYYPASLTRPSLMPWHPAAEENFYRNPILSWFADNWKCIPIKRGRKDLGAIFKMAKGLMTSPLILFPEGTRARTGSIGKGRLGAGLLILETWPTVIPVCIDGMDRVLPIGSVFPRFFRRIYISYGRPLDLSEFRGKGKTKRTANALMSQVMRAIKGLHKRIQEMKEYEQAARPICRCRWWIMTKNEDPTGVRKKIVETVTGRIKESPLRVGLIGVGKHGSRYAKHIHEDLPEIDLIGLWRRNTDEGKRQARQYGCRYFHSYSDLLSDKSIDAVVVVLPSALNLSVCKEAAYRGKHILIEKPMATNLREAIQIRQAVSDHAVRLMVSQTLRFNSVVRAVKDCIPQLGSLHSIHLSQRFEPSPLAWMDQRNLSGGGIVLHTGVHSFDLLRFLTQEEVDKVSCTINRVRTRETEDNFSAIMTFEKRDIIASVMGSRETKGRNGLIEVAGQNGQLVADHVHNYLYMIRGMERKPVELGDTIPTVCEALRAFYYSLRQKVPFPVTIEDGAIAVAIAEACYRSAETGRWEKVYHSDAH